MRWTLVGQLCTFEVFALVKLPNDCGLGQSILLRICWTTSRSSHVERLENLLGGVCVMGLGKGLVSQAAASGSEV